MTPPGGGLARHRSVARRVVPITFVVLAVAAIVLTLPIGPASSGRFDHRYASVPAAGILPFGSSISAVPASNLLLGVRVTSLALLDEALPFGVVTRVGNTFTLHQPVLVANGGSLDVSGPGELVLAGGSYIEIGPGAAGTSPASRSAARRRRARAGSCSTWRAPSCSTTTPSSPSGGSPPSPRA